jgi:hypothetical protein
VKVIITPLAQEQIADQLRFSMERFGPAQTSIRPNPIDVT